MLSIASIFHSFAKAGGRGAAPRQRDETRAPRIEDALGRYRYLVKVAPAEAIERATAEALAALPRADSQRIRYRLHQSEFRDSEPTGSASAPDDESLWLQFVSAFVCSPAARAFLASSGSSDVHLEREPDFSEEFGYERGYAGGSGFENVDFDKWI